MKYLLVLLIAVYQRVISPYKGFKCAHRVVYGGESCSQSVKHILLQRGPLGGAPAIKRRFQACASAAQQLNTPKGLEHHGDLDCGMSAGFGCFDVGGGSSCCAGDSSTSLGDVNKGVTISISLTVLVVILAWMYWTIGLKIESIDIRLIADTTESQQSGILNFLDGDKPDYQIVFETTTSPVSTNVLRNTLANDWIRLNPKDGIYVGDIQRIVILDKEIGKDRILDAISNVSTTGRGERYDYRIKRVWSLF